MAKQKKQFRELTEEELEKVNGGLPPLDRSCGGGTISELCKKMIMDKDGCLKCISD